MKEMSTKDIIY